MLVLRSRKGKRPTDEALYPRVKLPALLIYVGWILWPNIDDKRGTRRKLARVA